MKIEPTLGGIFKAISPKQSVVPWESPDDLVDEAWQKALAPWVEFYKKYFNLDLKMTKIKIPDHTEGFDRLIIIAKGISINQVYETMQASFPSWKWCVSELEEEIQVSQRGEVKKTYAIWARDIEGIDKDLKHISAEKVERPMDTENLLERLIHGFKYWAETGTHLDSGTYTLCASSRYICGDVPRVRLIGVSDVGVGKCSPTHYVGGIGVRRVVR